MKAWEIIGWAVDGALYHDGCQPDESPGGDAPTPIFASTEIDREDYCDHCLREWIDATPHGERKTAREQAPHVFLIQD